MRLRIFAFATFALLALTSCSGAAGASSSIVDAGQLRIGVKASQPGLGVRTQHGTYQGFDVDVATYIAEHLGFAEEDIEFVTVTSDEREESIIEDRVDLIVASYSITSGRKSLVSFAGPYLIAHQDTMVRADDESIRELEDLVDKDLCQEAGSNSAIKVVAGEEVNADIVEGKTYRECTEMLAAGEADAVSTDDVILAGFLNENPSAFRILDKPFTDERYGVGIAKDDLVGCAAVNTAITEMYQDGTAENLINRWFGETGLDVRTSLPRFAGCT